MDKKFRGKNIDKMYGEAKQNQRIKPKGRKYRGQGVDVLMSTVYWDKTIQWNS
jgi:hypothetical protein